MASRLHERRARMDEVVRVSGWLLLGALAACRSSLAASPDVIPPPTAEPAHDESEWSSLTFATASTCAPRWSDDVSARIAFDESHTSRLGVPLAGRVTQVAVERGQQVAAGAPLFTVASADLADLHAQRDKARIELATARTSEERVRALVAAHSLPAKELLAATQDLAEAELADGTSVQKLAALRIGTGGDSSFTVTAPRSGAVVDLHVAVGQQVSPDAGLLLAIADLSKVWVYANLVDDASRKLAVGTPARVTLEDGSTIDGAIDQVSAIVDPDRHTVPIRVALSNPAGALRPGGYADVRFFEPAASGSCVPLSAVMSDGTNHYVYVRAAGKLHRRVVSVSRPDAGATAIRAGLVVGEVVVAVGGGVLDNQLSSED